MKKKPWELAFWIIPPNLLLTSYAAPSEKEIQSSSVKYEQTTTEPSRSATPLVAPKLNRSVNITTTGDFIWWKSNLANMEYAWAGVADNLLVPLGQAPSRGKIKAPNFKFEPGFKVGCGLDFRHDGWDLYANYTWLNANGNSQIIGQPNVGLFTTFPPTFENTPAPILDASCKWKQHFNVLDLELGRNFFISRYLTLRPHFGLKGDWITEKFHTHYNTNSGVGNFGSFDVIRKETAIGIGIRAGLDTVWHFWKNFGLYGDIAATALWSDFHLRIKEPVNNILQITAPLTTNSYEKIQQVTPVVEAGLGLIYLLWFNNDHSLFYAKAGWEEQIWIDYNQIIKPILTPKCGDLSLQGLTVEFGFTF